MIAKVKRVALAVALTMGSIAGFVSPAYAEVTHVSDQGFAVLHVTKINAPPEKVWSTLLAPQSFWNGSHSWSGDAANMYLDPQAGGCFCEKLPVKAGDGGGLNSVEHMRVVYSERPRVLRMSGALGPLQSEGLSATLNIAMEADGTGTKISMSYVVGGFMRMKPADIAPAVDAVIGEQLLRLKAKAEGRDPAAVTWPQKKAETPATAGASDGAPAKDPAKESAVPLALPANSASTPGPAKSEPEKVKAVPTEAANSPATASTAAPKPPLGDRLKAADTPTESDSNADAAASDKKKPIVEDTAKPRM